MIMFDMTVFDNINLEEDSVPMKTGKSSSWLGEYHWVSLPTNDNTDNRNLIQSAREWCKEYYGKSGSRWFENKEKFYFKDEKDMSMFILKFCS